MRLRRTRKQVNSGGFFAPAVAFVLLVSGVGLVSVFIVSQRSAPAVATGWLPMIGEALEARSIPAIPRTRESKNRESKTRGPVMDASQPVRLDIPSIDVHSVLLHLGQTPEGALEVPPPGPQYNEAAWYRYSPTPGSLGPAVLLGHVDSAADGPSVFFRLGELRPGDYVSVTRADGSIARFVVDEVRRYPKDAFPTDRVYGDIDHAGLRILTCGGVFEATSGHYLDNIVVFASLAS